MSDQPSTVRLLKLLLHAAKSRNEKDSMDQELSYFSDYDMVVHYRLNDQGQGLESVE